MRRRRGTASPGGAAATASRVVLWTSSMPCPLDGAAIHQPHSWIGLIYSNPPPFGGVPGLHFARFNLVIPAVQFETAFAQAGHNLGMRGQMIQLQANVEFGQE